VPRNDILVRPLEETDLSGADRIFRLAFGTFLRVPDPLAFGGDADYVRTRWAADPSAAFAAESGGELVGSNFVTRWGSVGFFGPLTVRPDLWDQGIARRMLERTMELFTTWGTRHLGLFTFAHSPKHVALYQKYGFWPRFLTAIMSRLLETSARNAVFFRFSEVPPNRRADALRECRELTDAIYQGLDLEHEIRAVDEQQLGDTVLLRDDHGLAAMAVCHCGPGTEAGSGACYVKFGAVRPGAGAGEIFERLLDACEALAAGRGLSRIVAGVNMARIEAYRRMLAHGLRIDFQGVAMHSRNDAGYNRPDVYVIDDWR